MKQKAIDCGMTTYVATLAWIQAHSAQEITHQMPADYYKGVGKDAYTAALNCEKDIFNPTGVMPTDGRATCLTVVGAFNDKVKGKQIDLNATYTDEFVEAAQPVS
jgi:NitT/TauT family transport system substrate-binding protein